MADGSASPKTSAMRIASSERSATRASTAAYAGYRSARHVANGRSSAGAYRTTTSVPVGRVRELHDQTAETLRAWLDRPFKSSTQALESLRRDLVELLGEDEVWPVGELVDWFRALIFPLGNVGGDEGEQHPGHQSELVPLLVKAADQIADAEAIYDLPGLIVVKLEHLDEQAAHPMSRTQSRLWLTALGLLPAGDAEDVAHARSELIMHQVRRVPGD